MGVADHRLIRADILEAISKERKRQDRLWGSEFDDKNTPNDWVAYITNYVAAGAYDGRHEKFTVEGFRANLLKAATVCVAAVETIDRNNGKLAKRHYDRED